MLRELFALLKADDLLRQAWDDSRTMLQIGQEMTLEAVRVLRESDDMEVDRAIRAKDKTVNQYERDIRRMAMTHCTLRGASELPSSMALISIVIDIERIGDYSKNIMDLAVAHPERLSIPEFEDELQAIESSVKTRFRETIGLLETQDEAKAIELLSTYKEEISRACDGMVNNIVRGEVSSLAAPDAAAAALYVRYLKRIGAHLKNVTTCIVNPLELIGFQPPKDKAR